MPPPLDDSDLGPVQRLVYNREKGTHELRPPTEKFIKGPIPLAWMRTAHGLGGKAGAVGLALWFLAGVQKSRTVHMTGEVAEIAACNRKTVYNALALLEQAGLVKLDKAPGRRPRVTLLSAVEQSNPDRG